MPKIVKMHLNLQKLFRKNCRSIFCGHRTATAAVVITTAAMMFVLTSGLMQENLRLSEEIRSVKKQMGRERQQLEAEIQRLESNADEFQAQLERTAEEHRLAVNDYCQKIDSLDKQLKSDKQFIEVWHIVSQVFNTRCHATV